MRERLAAVVIGLLLGAWAITAWASDAARDAYVDPDTLRVLWADEDHLWPSFVPQGVIGNPDLENPDGVDLSHTPFTRSQQAGLRFFLNPSTDSGDGECIEPPRGCGGPDMTRDALVDLVESYPVAVVGTAKKSVPGWVTSLRTPGSLIYLEVEEVLRDRFGATGAGHTLAYVQRFGEIELSGKRLCARSPGGEAVEVNQRYLVLGFLSEAEPDVLEGALYYPLRDDTIQPGDTHFLRNSSPVALLDLREALDRGEG